MRLKFEITFGGECDWGNNEKRIQISGYDAI